MEKQESKNRFPTFPQPRRLRSTFSYGIRILGARPLGWQFNFNYEVTILNVLWALGWSMIVLGGLIQMPMPIVTGFGLSLVLGHNALDGLQLQSPLLKILHQPGFLLVTPIRSVFVAYPLVPWIGVTALGFSLGQAFRWEASRRRAWLLRMGLALSAAFVLLRALNVYGDPSHWGTQRTATLTLVSFLNCTKYPPSLLFLLMTLGPLFVFLWAIDAHTPKVFKPALVYGSVPMFYYLLHVPMIHITAILICFARYGQIHWMFDSPTISNFPITPPPGWGFGLPTTYFVWVLVVVALYAPCRWYRRKKSVSSNSWLSYL